MGALQLLGPTEGSMCSGTQAVAKTVLLSETAAPAASTWMFKSNSEPRQRACLRPVNAPVAGSSTGKCPMRRDAGTRLPPPRAYLHQVLSWAAWHRQVNSAGDAPCPWARVLAHCQAPGTAPGRPTPAAASPGADCPPALSQDAPTPHPLPGVSIVNAQIKSRHTGIKQELALNFRGGWESALQYPQEPLRVYGFIYPKIHR